MSQPMPFARQSGSSSARPSHPISLNRLSPRRERAGPRIAGLHRMSKSITSSLISCLLALMTQGSMAMAQPSTPQPPPGEGATPPPGEKEFNRCKKIPGGKRILKLNMKPDSEVSDLIAWISMVSCAQFIVPADTPVKGKKVTIMTTQLMTLEEAYQLFLDTLASVNLKVEPEGKFLRIVEVKPRTGAAPK
jgi:hypothetical protein